MKRPEILAPAGSMESLLAAVRCGADAVYIGGTMYSARSSATNFDLEQLAEASRICRLYGVKLHLAVNTLVTDTELPAFREYLCKAGQYADACIVQDLGAVRSIREVLPDMEIHASTQMSIHSPAGAELAAKLGCKRVVAAREMSKSDLGELCKLPIEVEAFVHGALCMSVSGQCSFSAIVGGRSANRGACAQACRLPWAAAGSPHAKGEKYMLSLKDLSLVEHVQELCDIGIDSLKIEGRMKRPEYVAAAVTALRMALDGEQPDLETLQAVFSRSGFTDGYFTGRKQNMFGFRRKEDVLAGGKVLDDLAKLYAKPRQVTALDFSLHLADGEPARMDVTDGAGNCLTVEGDIPQIPQKSPLTQELFAKSMQKLGGTVYTCGTVTLDDPAGLFLSAAQCNALRREAVEEMDALRTAKAAHLCRIERAELELPCDREVGAGQYRLHVRTAGQLTAALETGCITCIPLKLAENCEPSEQIYLEAPRIIANEENYRETLHTLYAKGFRHLVCHNLADIQIGGELGFVLHGGFGLNVTNRLTALTLREQGLQDVCASIELRMPRIFELGKVLPAGAMVYGRLPMMLYRVCPIKSQEGCRKRGCALTDRTGRTFPLLCSGHYQELMNSETLWLAGRDMPIDWRELYFTDETPGQISQVLESYRSGAGDAPQARTAGLYYKGGLQ